MCGFELAYFPSLIMGCYAKFWNVKVAPHKSGPFTETLELRYIEEEQLESPASLKEKQLKMEKQVNDIWT